MTNSPAIVTMVAPVGSCQNHDARYPPVAAMTPMTAANTKAALR